MELSSMIVKDLHQLKRSLGLWCTFHPFYPSGALLSWLYLTLLLGWARASFYIGKYSRNEDDKRDLIYPEGTKGISRSTPRYQPVGS